MQTPIIMALPLSMKGWQRSEARRTRSAAKHTEPFTGGSTVGHMFTLKLVKKPQQFMPRPQ